MYHPSTLLKQSRDINTTISVASLVFISLTVWILFSKEILSQPVKGLLLTGVVIILSYYYSIFITRKTLYVAKTEFRLRKILLASLRRRLEMMDSLEDIMEELGELPIDVAELLIGTLTSSKEETLTRYVSNEITGLENWQAQNEEPDGKNSESAFEEVWIEKDKKLAFLRRIRTALT